MNETLHNQVFMHWFDLTKKGCFTRPCIFLFNLPSKINLPINGSIKFNPNVKATYTTTLGSWIYIFFIWLAPCCVFGTSRVLRTVFWSPPAQRPAVWCLPLKETQLHRNRFGKKKKKQADTKQKLLNWTPRRGLWERSSNCHRKPLQQGPTHTGQRKRSFFVTMQFSQPMNVITYASLKKSQHGLNTARITSKHTNNGCALKTVSNKTSWSELKDHFQKKKKKNSLHAVIHNILCSFNKWSRHTLARKNSLRWNCDIAKNTRPTSTDRLGEVTLMRFYSQAVTSVAKTS